MNAESRGRPSPFVHIDDDVDRRLGRWPLSAVTVTEAEELPIRPLAE
jgi:hypothetical protein